MTARMVPEGAAFASDAEQLFVTALREQLPDDAVLVCNQRFTDRGADREADVIVAWPGHGVAVLEVKGGSVSLREGQWWQTGGRSKAIHPVEQALTCKYALRDFLYAAPRWSRGNPRLVHMVALPTTTLAADFVAPDAPRWALIDKSELSSAAGRIASALRGAENQPDAPSQDDVDLLVDCLVGTLIPQADLVAPRLPPALSAVRHRHRLGGRRVVDERWLRHALPAGAVRRRVHPVRPPARRSGRRTRHGRAARPVVGVRDQVLRRQSGVG